MRKVNTTAGTGLTLDLHVFASVKVYRAGKHFILALPDRIYVADADHVRTIKKRKFARIERVLRQKGVIA